MLRFACFSPAVLALAVASVGACAVGSTLDGGEDPGRSDPDAATVDASHADAAKDASADAHLDAAGDAKPADGAADAHKDATDDAHDAEAGADAASDAGSCGAQQKKCGATCVGNDPNFGCYGVASCNPCLAPANAVSTCSASGACDFACSSGFVKQAGQCVQDNPSSCPSNEPFGPCIILANPDTCQYGSTSCDCALFIWVCQ